MMMKPLAEIRPSDDEYSRRIKEDYEELMKRLKDSDAGDVTDLCDQVYKTGYLDGVKDTLAMLPD